ncbi:MAG: DUF1254 domain-containing protein [Pseudomonadota bacterium]
MKTMKHMAAAMCTGVIGACLFTGCARLNIAEEAYIYGYPLVTMDMTRRQETNVRMPDDAHAPMGQLIKMRSYPAVDNHTAAAPNADTLYTMVWMDVSTEPWVFSIPDMGDRFYIMPMLNGFNEVFYVSGQRATGGKAQKYIVTGPGWSGVLPEGVTQVKSPTALVWILGRIYCTGTPEDYKAVHELQDKFSSVPLSSYGKPYTPPPGVVDETFDMKKAVRKQVNEMTMDEFFSRLVKLLKTNPPAPEDAPIIARMEKIGIVPGQEFDRSRMPLLGEKLDQKLSLLKMVEDMKAKKAVNGWLYWTRNAGSYGIDYMQRAMVTLIGPGLNYPQDAVYPFSEKDADGKEYDGAYHQYVMHFEKGRMPPVKGFWSLTMYDPNFFFVPNQIKRYNLSQRNTFVTNPDGSMDVYLQAESPGADKEFNWLPAPKGKFILMLRLYWPEATPPSILDGSWKPPAVKRVQ